MSRLDSQGLACVASHFTCPVQSYCTGVCDVARQGLAAFYEPKRKSYLSLFSDATDALRIPVNLRKTYELKRARPQL